MPQPVSLTFFVASERCHPIAKMGEANIPMAFKSMKLKPESGANRIKCADDAYSFVMHMRLSSQNKPHWQVAKQALNHAGASDECENLAWRKFRAAAAAEGWLLD